MSLGALEAGRGSAGRWWCRLLIPPESGMGRDGPSASWGSGCQPGGPTCQVPPHGVGCSLPGKPSHIPGLAWPAWPPSHFPVLKSPSRDGPGHPGLHIHLGYRFPTRGQGVLGQSLGGQAPSPWGLPRPHCWPSHRWLPGTRTGVPGRHPSWPGVRAKVTPHGLSNQGHCQSGCSCLHRLSLWPET